MLDLPDWLPSWCVEQLGAEPVGVLFERWSVSAVFGVRLGDGREVVVKAREDDGRAAAAESAVGALESHRFRVVANDRVSR